MKNRWLLFLLLAFVCCFVSCDDRSKAASDPLSLLVGTWDCTFKTEGTVRCEGGEHEAHSFPMSLTQQLVISSDKTATLSFIKVLYEQQTALEGHHVSQEEYTSWLRMYSFTNEYTIENLTADSISLKDSFTKTIKDYAYTISDDHLTFNPELYYGAEFDKVE